MSTTANPPIAWLVALELKRLQTYLFSLPLLRVMIGANALVGETWRGLWTPDGFADQPLSLPRLAQDCGSRWPEGVSQNDRFEQDDPLVTQWRGQPVWQDDVLQVARRSGVLTRDGGHFEALFPSKDAACNFIEQAQQVIGAQLPGVLVDVRLSEICRDGDSHRKVELASAAEPLLGRQVLDLPFAEACQWSGQEPASKQLSERDGKPYVGESALARDKQGQAFDKGKTADILGILRPEMLRCVNAREGEAFPSELAGLSVGGYIGVVHIDGNSVGRRYQAHQGKLNRDFFDRWLHRERFFHTMRTGMRQAVLKALGQTFQKRESGNKIPLRMLMLGGDDLVLVCGAPYALKFVVKLAKSVCQTTTGLTTKDGKSGPLTLGAGVAIVREKFPFHRAHELAEQLANSAKRLAASLPDSEGNVVDWIVTTEAWYGDIRDTRQQTAVVDDTVLSGKPYRILAPPGETNRRCNSLEQLLEDARALAALTPERQIARSQMQRLAASLHDGRHTARFVAETLPTPLRRQLKDRGYLRDNAGPWINDSPPFVTQFHDLLELYELELLKGSDPGEQAQAREPDEQETADV